MGRLLTSQQITDGQTYNFGYTYNLSGALIEETYPSGRVVKNTLNADGELSQVQSGKCLDATPGTAGTCTNRAGFFTYADSFTYNSSGAVTKMQLGNGKWETASYNERLQITQIGLGLTPETQNLLKLEVKYNTTGQTDNNGSMREQKITVPAVGSNPTFTATQSYAYDSLNRIQSATENINGNPTPSWKQTFSYDRFGNRRFDAANTTTLGSCTASVCNPEINTSDNRLKKDQAGGTAVDYDYDANGALLKDFNGQRFGYDAESHQKEFFSASNQTTTPDATYHYDGEGRRVKKIVGTEVTVFVYDASGQLSAEYSTTVAPVEQAKVSYLTTDHLGSPRIITDQNGSVISRKDFAAFGDEVVSPQRVGGSNGNGYDPPNVRQDYTGYQKDNESGLEFAQARYYNTGHGRFTSVDPLTASATIKNPQTLNRYAYVVNSPYEFVDPLGLALSDIGVYQTTDGLEARRAEQQSLRDLQLTINQQYRDANAELFAPETKSQTTNVTRKDATYDVEGDNAEEAFENADASKANDKCESGKPGCTRTTGFKSTLGQPGFGPRKKVKGGYQVTERPFAPAYDVTITVYLPNWKGYASASEAEQRTWDQKIADLKDHEEGHVEITKEAVSVTAQQLARALPASRTFVSKTNSVPSITAQISQRYKAAKQVVAEGFSGWEKRDSNYDVLTKSGMIPRQQVKY